MRKDCVNQIDPLHRKEKMFCSRRCFHLHRVSKRVKRICVREECKKEFYVIPCRVRKEGGGSFCSLACLNKHHTGENNSMFGRSISEESKVKQKKSLQEAWISGKFDGVNFGKVRWYSFISRMGDELSVQGKWELFFVRYLDDLKKKFISHPACLKYLDSLGEERIYMPDFYVEDFEDGKNCYIEIKNEYLLGMQWEKFMRIHESNSDVNIRILRGDDLMKLGINLMQEV